MRLMVVVIVSDRQYTDYTQPGEVPLLSPQSTDVLTSKVQVLRTKTNLCLETEAGLSAK